MSEIRRFMVKIDGPAITNQSVSFKLLANLLDGIQDTFNYIGLEITKREIKTRARVPGDVQQACELRRVIERPGSYELVAEISNPVQAEIFQGMDLGKATLDKYLGMTAWMSGESNDSEIRRIFPEENHRTRILKSVQKYTPREGDDWSLQFKEPEGTRQYGLINHQSLKKINATIYTPQYETTTITGELIRIHFDQHRIGIRYLPTGKILECSYNPEDEDAILDSRDGYLTISGLIEMDSMGNPDKIPNVTEINFLDLSPVKFSRINGDEFILELAKPLIVEPVFEDQEVVLNYDELNIIAAGQDRDEAIKDFEDDFIWLWREYAKADDQSLSHDALALKNSLLQMVGRVIVDSKEA